MPPPPVQPAQYQIISLDQINRQDDGFRITTREDVGDLLASIEHIGLVTPPLLVKQNSEYTIVSGFRRIAACRKLGWDDIIAGILAPGLTPFQHLRLAIAENALQRPLNLIETSRALHKISEYSKSFQQVAETAAICGLPTHMAVIKKIKDLCMLPLPVQHSILKETISLAMAAELAGLEPQTAIDFALFFEELKLSLNKQREMVMLVGEIARREDIAIQQVLAHQKLQQIVNNQKLDRGQKQRRIRRFLRRWRFPQIVTAEQHYEFHLKQLKLGPDIQLIPPKEFEGITYALTVRFTSLAHLKTLRSILENRIEHPSFEKILTGNDRLPR